LTKQKHQLSIYAAQQKKLMKVWLTPTLILWNIPITMLRFFTVYGPWGRPDMAYFKFTKKIIENKNN
jgi:UDP-glucuronate 4-epimerase